jgi:tetratricopeptide (TPR) repeat protein
MASLIGGLRTKLQSGERAPSRRRGARARAQRAWDRGDLRRALAAYRQALRSQPNDARVWLKVGELHEKLGEKNQAVTAFTRAAEQFTADAHERQAVSILHRVLTLDPESCSARLRMADLQLRLDRPAEALEQYREILAELRENEDRSTTLSTLASIASLDPDDIGNRLELAGLRFETGQHDAARTEYCSLLRVLQEREDWRGLLDAARTALRDLPRDTEIAALLEEATRGRNGSSGEHSETRLARDPADTSACAPDMETRASGGVGGLHDLAVAYMEMGAYQRALDEIEAQPFDSYARIAAAPLMARCLLALDRADEAVTELEQAVVAAGDDFWLVTPLRYELGVALIAAGDRERALEMLRGVASETPGYRDVDLHLAEIGEYAV